MKAIPVIVLVLILAFLPACTPNTGNSGTPSPLPAETATPVPENEPESVSETMPPSKTFQLVIVESAAESQSTRTVVGLSFAELIKERTEGVWDVETISSSEESIVSQLQSGSVSFACLRADDLNSAFPEISDFDGSDDSKFLDKIYKEGILGLSWFGADEFVLIAASVVVWENLSPDEQIIIKQCALEAALLQEYT